MKPLQLNNSWMTLHTKSMSKVHEVLYLAHEDCTPIRQLVRVAEIAGRSAWADPYGHTVPSFQVHPQLDAQHFIKVDGVYYPVTLVTNCPNEANQHMMERLDTALMASDNQGFHYLVLDQE